MVRLAEPLPPTASLLAHGLSVPRLRDLRRVLCGLEHLVRFLVADAAPRLAANLRLQQRRARANAPTPAPTKLGIPPDPARPETWRVAFSWIALALRIPAGPHARIRIPGVDPAAPFPELDKRSSRHGFSRLSDLARILAGRMEMLGRIARDPNQAIRAQAMRLARAFERGANAVRAHLVPAAPPPGARRERSAPATTPARPGAGC